MLFSEALNYVALGAGEREKEDLSMNLLIQATADSRKRIVPRLASISTLIPMGRVQMVST
jgi:hypothetical protein